MDNNMNVQNNLAPQYVPEQPKEKKLKEKKEKKSKLFIGIIAGVVAAMVAIAVIAIMIATAPKTIDLSDYVTCSFSGYDHLGEANVAINFVDAAKKYQDDLGIKSQADLSSALVTMNECITVKVESYTGLANRQEFVVKFDIDNKLMKERYNCVLKCKEVRTVVEKLTDLIEIDPFEYIELEYSNGLEYSTSVNIEYKGEHGSAIRGCAEMTDGKVINGTEVVIGITKDVKWFADRGYYPTVLEKKYVVEGLDTYFGIKVSDIEQEDINKNLKEVKAKIMSEKETITDVVYSGAVIVESEEKSSRDSNYVLLAYEVKVSDGTGDWSYYYYSIYKNIRKKYKENARLDGIKYENPTATKGWFTIYGTGFERNGQLYAGCQTMEEATNSVVGHDGFVVIDSTVK